jgi:hypothetical protein
LSGVPVPKRSYLDECISIKAKSDRKRWKSKDGKRLYEWDSLHGEIEVYNAQGWHLGVLNPNGDMIKSAIKGRKIDV